MNIRYLIRGLEIDDRTKDYIEKRLKAFEKLVNKILQIEVEIDLDKRGKFRVEIMLCTPYKKYRTEETSSSIEASVDIAEGEIREQIAKDKGKLETLRKRGRISLKKKMVLDKNARF
jgi:ribosomal subunit interface protein